VSLIDPEEDAPRQLRALCESLLLRDVRGFTDHRDPGRDVT